MVVTPVRTGVAFPRGSAYACDPATAGRLAMLTRRGFASCALCAITGFITTEASAHGAPAAAGGVTRKILSQTDGPAAGYETVLVEATIEAGAAVGRHTHPGIE